MAITSDIWSVCYQGKMQSPINISTKHLVFDTNLEPIKILGLDKQVSAQSEIRSFLMFCSRLKI